MGSHVFGLRTAKVVVGLRMQYSPASQEQDFPFWTWGSAGLKPNHESSFPARTPLIQVHRLVICILFVYIRFALFYVCFDVFYIHFDVF